MESGFAARWPRPGVTAVPNLPNPARTERRVARSSCARLCRPHPADPFAPSDPPKDLKDEIMVITGAHLTPLVAIIAGILILIMPRLLNYIVAIYLIFIGLVGLNNVHHFINWH
jgi:Protein of unknown function (DUF3096)